MPKYECTFNMNEHEIVNAKNKKEATEKIEDRLRYLFSNELDIADISEVDE